MYLHKYKKGSMTFYGIMGQKKAPAVVELNSDLVTDAVPFKNVLKSYISDLDGAMEKLKNTPEEKSETSEEPKEPEKSEKTAVSGMIRKYAQMIGSFDKE